MLHLQFLTYMIFLLSQMLQFTSPFIFILFYIPQVMFLENTTKHCKKEWNAKTLKKTNKQEIHLVQIPAGRHWFDQRDRYWHTSLPFPNYVRASEIHTEMYSLQIHIFYGIQRPEKTFNIMLGWNLRGCLSLSLHNHRFKPKRHCLLNL